MNIASVLSVYPKGVEKCRNSQVGNNIHHTQQAKDNALAMLKKGMSVKFVSMNTGIPEGTINCWKIKERY